LFTLVDNTNKNKLVKKLIGSNLVSIDTETTSKNPIECTPLLLQLGIEEDLFIIDLNKQKNFASYVIKLIIDSGKLSIMHNAKYDLKVIYRVTGEWMRSVHDTMLAEVLINQGLSSQYFSLASLVEKYCGVVLDKEVRLTFEGFNPEVDSFTQEQLLYSVLDVKYLPDIYQKQVVALQEQRQQRVLDLENELVSTVAKMEYSGLLLDKKAWLGLVETLDKQDKEVLFDLYNEFRVLFATKEFSNALEAFEFLAIPVGTKKFQKELSETTVPENIAHIVCSNVNFNSNKQIGCIIGQLCGIPGLSSVDKKTLGKFRFEYEFINLLLTHRDLEKKMNTYGENFIDYISPVDGRIHCELNQLGTETGRFSSNTPNMQNIPKKNEYRTAFVARSGYKIITADYSQAELRLLAAVSHEEVMSQAFIDGIDLHIKTASLLFGVPVEEVTKDQRKDGKTLNFAVVYGTTEYGLLYNFGLPIETGRDYLRKYFTGYPNLGRFIPAAGKKILELGYSVTPYGRRRNFEAKVLYKDAFEYEKLTSAIKREGINHIIQGGSADIVKLSMVTLDRTQPFGDEFRILLQVHDELVFEVREEIVEEATAFVKKTMEEVEQRFLGKIPAVLDVFISDSWYKD